MKNIKRAEELQRAVNLVRDSIEGKEVSALEFRDALVNTCILVEQLMKENSKLKRTARALLKEKRKMENYAPQFVRK